MVEITLNAVEIDLRNSETGGRAERKVQWPAVPREGEQLWVGGNSFEVNEVWHWIDETPDRIQVDFYCNTDDFENILSGLTGWHRRSKLDLAADKN